MAPLFVVAILASALLLFDVEPLVAKLLLPLLGGTAAVWTACLVFFQVALLAGYLYAHYATKLLGLRRQAIAHVALLALSLAALPVALPAGTRPDEAASPFLQVLWILLRTVGVPFLLLSANTPMLSRWFAATTSGRDPYPLYAASNVGSMVALFGYPLVVEPFLRLGTQTRAWSVGYVGLAIVIAAGALATFRARPATTTEEAPPGAPPTWRDRGTWLVLSAVPSSLLLGVTTYLSLDVAPMPLLWVVPLAIYLATFIVVFSPWGERVHPSVLRLSAMPLLLVALLLAWGPGMPPAVPLALHLLTFALLALAVHGELARRRPSPAHLTEFYLWMSVGGVVGGLANGLVAPLVFDRPLEYPLALAIAAGLRPSRDPGGDRRARLVDVAVPIAFLIALVVLDRLGGDPFVYLRFGLCLLVTVVGLRFSRRPLRFGLTIAALVIAGAFRTRGEHLLHLARNFFGVHRVFVTEEGRVVTLGNGTTLHGEEFTDPNRPLAPRGYYHRDGPLGTVMAAAQRKTNLNIGVVGLGIGSSSCYARPGDRFSFFEIDPDVIRIATDRRYFRSLSECAPTARLVLGDARLELAGEPDRGFDVLVLDAFSSDAVPAHLLTREAFALYERKLAPGGLIGLHISNRFLDLKPVVSAGGAAAGLLALDFLDPSTPEAHLAELHDASEWTLLARSRADLGPLADDARWAPIAPTRPPWTDDFSNIVSVFHFR